MALKYTVNAYFCFWKRIQNVPCDMQLAKSEMNE